MHGQNHIKLKVFLTLVMFQSNEHQFVKRMLMWCT